MLVCNANQEAWKWKNVKRKTDRDDALKLAKLAAVGQLVPVYIPCRQQREYRSLVKYRKVVLGRLNRVQNNIRAILPTGNRDGARPEGLGVGTVGAAYSTSQTAPDCSLDELWRGELDLELVEFQRLSQHHQQIHKQLQALPPRTNASSSCKRFQVWAARRPKWSWPTWTIRIASRMPGKSRPTPAWSRRYQSGTMDRHGKIHKRGPRLLRGALVEAAWLTLRYNPWARSVYQRICGKQKTRRKKAIVAVARKLLVRCWVMLLRKERWNPEALPRSNRSCCLRPVEAWVRSKVCFHFGLAPRATRKNG